MRLSQVDKKVLSQLNIISQTLSKRLSTSCSVALADSSPSVHPTINWHIVHSIDTWDTTYEQNKRENKAKINNLFIFVFTS